MNALVSCKNEEVPIKSEGARVVTTFPHCKYMGILGRLRAAYSAVHGRSWPNFELILDFMVVLITCKMNKIKSKGARVFTIFYIDFQMLKGR